MFLSPIWFCSPKGFVPPELEWITDSDAIYMYSDKKKLHRFRIYKVYRKHIGPLVLTVMAWKSGKRCTEQGTECVCLQYRQQHSTKRPHTDCLYRHHSEQNQQKDHISNKQFLNAHNTVLKNIARSNNEEVANQHNPQKMESQQNKSRKMCVIDKVAAVPPKAKKMIALSMSVQCSRTIASQRKFSVARIKFLKEQW